MKQRGAFTTIVPLTVMCLLALSNGRDKALAMVDPSPPDARPAPADYDGDGSTDIAVKGSNGVWYIDLGANGIGGRWDHALTDYGDATAVPVAGDYDGDGLDDLSVKSASGVWAIDFASTGFGVWDTQYLGYGDGGAVPVPADYDGDGKADLSVKDGGGAWYIANSGDGIADGWDVFLSGYGNSAAIPVPADYDGDGHADLAVKFSDECWYIDYWIDGYGGWNEIRCGYGDATAVPCPADYDNDGRADLSVKGGDGTWFVDYASDGFGAWNAIYSGYGGNLAIAVPGDYDGDGLLDLSVCSITAGYWFIDFAANGFSGWDTIVDNPNRALVDTARPYITSTTIYGEGNQAVTQCVVGVRYTVDVVVHRGTGPDNAAGVEVNDALNVPASLQLVNRRGSTYVSNIGDANGTPVIETHRRFALTCTQEGNFPLGFQLRNVPPYFGGSEVFNPDYGIRVIAVRPLQTALTGRVTQRVQNAQGVFVQGPPLEGAIVTLVSSGGITTTTDANGKWHFPVAYNGMAVKITRPGYSEIHAVNLSVPVAGFYAETDIEGSFTLPAGVTYKTYLDYSRGRTRFHVVEVDPALASVRIGKAGFDPGGPCHPTCSPATQCPSFITLRDVGTSLNPYVLMNATPWNICNGNPLGYMYAQGSFLNSEVWCDNRGGPADCSGSNVYYVEGAGTTPLYPAGTTPMLAIHRIPGDQQFDIVESNSNFLESPSTQWSMFGSYPVWDVSPRDGLSDVLSALQAGYPPLLRNGAVIAGGDFAYDLFGNYDYAFARTTVGVGPNGKLFLVVADGEGVHGGNGATANQVARFYRDVLGATHAMGLDSGVSSEMFVKTPAGLHNVNTITSEDAGFQLNPYTDVLPEAQGSFGSVGYYLAVMSVDVTAAPVSETPLSFAVRVRSSVGTRFRFDVSVPQAGDADLRLFDVQGRQVAVAFRGELSRGSHSLTWQARLASGVYYYRLTLGTNRAVGSVVVLK